MQIFGNTALREIWGEEDSKGKIERYYIAKNTAICSTVGALKSKRL
jgi:hypothetical protein